LIGRSGSIKEMNPMLTRKVMAAGTIGNVLEWYDFAIYGYFASAIGRHFFPREDPVAQLLAAFGVFAVGYLMRPIGGALIGHIGDRFGRRTSLTLSVAAMAIPTFLIGLLPGYETLGRLAPIALLLLRMIQGLSVGGEYTSSMVFLVERAPVERRGLIGAFACCGASAGILLGSAVGATFAAMMPNETLEAWGWRIPFLLGLVVGVVGFFLRRHVVEAAVERAEASPIVETLRYHWRLVARLAALSAFNAVGFYVMFVYVASWLQTADGISPAHALEINSISMAILLPVLLASGWLSDRLGRKPILMLSTVLAIVVALPLFWVMYHPFPGLIMLGQIGFVLVIGLFIGTQASTMVESAPQRIRCTAVAVGYNMCLGVIGGLTPLVATWLVARTEDELAPAYLIMAAATISFFATLCFKETYRTPLTMAAAWADESVSKPR
jgi:MHS family proline/betaine transporter-like MFS transporter